MVMAEKGGDQRGQVNDRAGWDARYRAADTVRPRAARVLLDNIHLLPTSGTALDLACGLGGNALLLAERGLQVQGWDFSAAAIVALDASARAASLPLTAIVRDVLAEPPAAASFDVIVVSHYLERSLAGALVAALRPGGLLFYQTFTRARVDDSGPRNAAFRLADNELLQLFSALRLRVYREEGGVGDNAQGFRNEAMLVAQRGRND